MNSQLAAREVLSSVVVFLVALPLCMGIAIASGVSPAAGLLSGIIGGIVVGTLAGSPLQVSGPAAGLTVLVFDVIQQHSLGILAVLIIAAGAMQILAGKLRVGQWFRAVSPGVIHAMLAGIGVLIVSGQLHVMIDDKPSASGLANLIALPTAVFKAVLPQGDAAHQMAAGIGLLTLASLIAWNVLRRRLPPWLEMLPAPLVGVAAATAVAAGLELPIAYVDMPDNLGAMIRLPTLQDLGVLVQPSMLGLAIALACVASAESLLSAAAVDKLHNGPRSDLDKELVAQGVGNMVLGFLGGLPVTGVIVRSSANVHAGASTRWSAVMHGVWMLAAVALVPFVLEAIPVSALAGVLVYVGYKLVNLAVLKNLWARSRGDAAVYVATVGTIVATSLLEGLLVGVVVSVVHLAWRFSHVDVRIAPGEGGAVEVDLRGTATFVGLPHLARALESIDPSAEVRLHLDRLDYIDHACFELIEDWERQREGRGGTLTMRWDQLEMRSMNPRKRPKSGAFGAVQAANDGVARERRAAVG